MTTKSSYFANEPSRCKVSNLVPRRKHRKNWDTAAVLNSDKFKLFLNKHKFECKGQTLVRTDEQSGLLDFVIINTDPNLPGIIGSFS